MGTIERVRDLALPVCEAGGVELVDIELAGGVLRLTVDRPGGLDLDVISGLTRRISRLLDDDDPVPGRYTLEVSSPGLERRLRTAEHFRRAVGEAVTVRTSAGTEPRRLKGTLISADDDTVSIRPEDGSDDDLVTVPLDRIERARTVFDWGPTPKKGGPKKASAKKASTPKGGAKAASPTKGGAKTVSPTKGGATTASPSANQKAAKP